MKTSVKELQSETKRIFGVVKQGKSVDVYFHRKLIAKIIPVVKEKPFKKDDGFGMWSDYSDTENVLEYVRRLRKGRQRDL